MIFLVLQVLTCCAQFPLLLEVLKYTGCITITTVLHNCKEQSITTSDKQREKGQKKIGLWTINIQFLMKKTHPNLYFYFLVAVYVSNLLVTHKKSSLLGVGFQKCSWENCSATFLCQTHQLPDALSSLLKDSYPSCMYC